MPVKKTFFPFVFLLFCMMVWPSWKSFAQDTNKFRVEYTNLNLLQHDSVVKVDSDLNFFHHYNYLYHTEHTRQLNYFYVNTGNVGSPAFRLSYDPGLNINYDPGLHQFDIYSLKNDEVLYYDTWSPFTRLYYAQGAKEMQLFDVLHTRNITPYWNVALLYKSLVSNGFYFNQKTKDKNFALTTRFTTKKGRYKVYFSAISNSFKSGENGGLKNDSIFEGFAMNDKTLSIVKLNNAAHSYTENNFSLLQILNLTKKDTGSVVKRFGSDKISIQHQVYYTKSNYTYNSDLSIDTGYYHAVYLDTNRTSDFLKSEILTNIFQINFSNDVHKRKTTGTIKNIKFNPGLLHETGTINQDTSKYNFYNMTAFIKSEINIGLIGFHFDLNYIISGTNNKDYYYYEDVSFTKRKFNVILGARQIKKSPTYIQNHLNSNHLIWNNHFTPNSDMNFFLEVLYKKFALSLNYHNLQNYIYIGSSLMPFQSHKNIDYVSAELQKTFKLGHFYFVNKVLYQSATNTDVMRYPDWIYYNTTYYGNRFFNKVMKLQAGFDFRFTDSYFPYSTYAPFSILYSGEENSLPSSLVMDLFINANVKRFNFFVKYENVNRGIPRDFDYLLPHYPADPRVFRFGVSWMFFD